MRTRLEVNGELLDEFDEDPGRNPFALFCPHCGDVWAKVHRDPSLTFYTLRRACPMHGLGSFFDSYGWAGELDLRKTPALLRWEFDRLLAAALKELKL